LYRFFWQTGVLGRTDSPGEGGVDYKLMATGNLSSGTWFEESLEIKDVEDQNGLPQGYSRCQVIVPNPSGNRFFRLQAVESSP